MLAVTITFERKGHSFDRLLLAPISLKVMVLAKIIGSVLFGIFNAFVPIIFGAFLSDLSDVNWGFVFIGVLFIAFSSTLVGLVIAVSAKEIFEAQTYSNFFRFPMIFFCGLFFPVSTLPIFLRPLSYALPLTYGVDILHIALVKSGTMSVWLDLLILSVFSVLLFYISMRNIQRKWIL